MPKIFVCVVPVPSRSRSSPVGSRKSIATETPVFCERTKLYLVRTMMSPIPVAVPDCVKIRSLTSSPIHKGVDA